MLPVTSTVAATGDGGALRGGGGGTLTRGVATAGAGRDADTGRLLSALAIAGTGAGFGMLGPFALKAGRGAGPLTRGALLLDAGGGLVLAVAFDAGGGTLVLAARADACGGGTLPVPEAARGGALDDIGRRGGGTGKRGVVPPPNGALDGDASRAGGALPVPDVARGSDRAGNPREAFCFCAEASRDCST